MGKIVKPTDEQRAIMDAARSGKSFKVYAGAGSGKTTTTRLAAAEVGPSVYVVFNRSGKDEAKGTFPETTFVSTAHGLAYREEGRDFGHRIANSIWQMKRALCERVPANYGIAEDVLSTFSTFLNSVESRVDESHVPDKARDPRRCVREATRMFGWATDRSDDFPLVADVYLKSWQLNGARIDYPTIFIDEAQDLSPVMLSILQQQTGKQMIYVGDPYQQIYAWRGAINALQGLDLPMLTLTSSWRFGQDVADVANSILEARKAPFAMVGMAKSSVHVGMDKDATGVIARTNGGLVASAVEAALRGRSVHVLGGVEQLTTMLEGAYAVKTGEKTVHPIFKHFKSFAELQETVNRSSGAEFKPFVKLVEIYGKETLSICATLKAAHVEKKSDADVTLGTTHKFKGQEADRLQVIDDSQPFAKFNEKSKTYSLDEEAANVAYVAVTRAKERLTLAPAFAAMLDLSLKNTEKYWEQEGSPLVNVSPRETLALVIARGNEVQNAEAIPPMAESAPGAMVAATPSGTNGKSKGSATIVNADEKRSVSGVFLGIRNVALREGARDVALVKDGDALCGFRESTAFANVTVGDLVTVFAMGDHVAVCKELGRADAAILPSQLPIAAIGLEH